MRDNSWRFIQTGFNDLYTNMAIDEAILIAYSSGYIPPTLRIYGWQPSAFSLGYFQNPEEVLNIDDCCKKNMPFVRRITAGGTIFHYRELSYSLVCSKDKINGCNSIDDSFGIISLFLVNAYKRLGLEPKFAVEQKPRFFKRSLTKRRDSFCFASKEKYDIVINGKKLGGSAQRRRKDIIFQHGSIPLKSDIDTAILFLKEKPHNLKNTTCSLDEVLGKEIKFSELKNVLRSSFEETNFVDLQEGDLTFEEKKLFHELKEKKYRNSRWNLYRIDNFHKIKNERNESFCQKACVA